MAAGAGELATDDGTCVLEDGVAPSDGVAESEEDPGPPDDGVDGIGVDDVAGAVPTTGRGVSESFDCAGSTAMDDVSGLPAAGDCAASF